MKPTKNLTGALLLAAGALIPLAAAAQTLAITNGIQTYGALTNTTVTMTGRAELRVTATNNPIPGCLINLNSSDAWFFLPAIRPSVVAATYLGQIRVNGATAVAGSNCRLDPYAMGTVIVPHAPSFAPLQVFGGPDFLGTSSQLGLYTYYTNTALGAMNRNIGSFKLKRGYSATFAEHVDGSGISKVYVAQDGDLEVGVLPDGLDHAATFVRVFPWCWTGKRGWDDTAGDSAIIKPLWFYDWGNGRTSDTDAEYAPMQWGGGYSSGINSKQKSTQLLSFNEPDSASQANLTVAAAIADWPNLMQSGLRVGAPAVSDSGVSGQGSDWLYSFMSQATNLGYRVDFIPIHWYKCGQSATQLSNYLASVHQVTGLPIWLTEFNYGANWCDVNGSLPPTPTQEATAVTQFLNVLENAPFVERYSIYNWVTTNREMVLDNGTLTPAGVIYVNRQSAMAYTQTLPPGGSRSIAQFQFETNTLDSSGYGNNGFAVGIPGYTTGHSGQAVALDGTNSFLRLPPTVASGSNFTFAAWVYWNGGGQWQRIFDFGNDTSHYLFLTPNSGSGTLRVAVKNGGSEQSFETTVLPAGQWTHVAVTLSSGSAKIYTNGVLAASSGSITIVPSNFNPNFNYLGKSQFPADPLFSGDLDEVQIADSAFTASQISALLTNSPPQFLTNFLAGGAATQSQVYSNTITGTATDPDPGDTLTYGKAGGPAWLTVSSAGILTGTPGAADGGTNHFTVRVSDAAGASAFAWLTIAVPVVNVSGIWSADASSDWSDTNRWSSGFVANGPGFTADFSAINITANRTVALDSARSIGTLKFGDTSGSQSWTIASSGGSILTLDTGSFTQPAAVVANTATITASLAGTNGFAKSGPGTLILGATSFLSGTLNIDTGNTTSNEGAVRAAQPAALANATTIQIRNNNNGSSTLQLDGTAGGVSVPARVNVSCRGVSTATIQNLAGTNTLSGFIALDVGGSFFNIQSDAGQLVFAGTNQYVGSLTGGRSYAFSGAGDHLVNGPIRNSTNGAPISLTKSGAGTLTLAGNNTYGGTTTVSGGALLVDGTLGAGGLTLSGGATLGGNGAISSAVTVPSGATLAPGASLGRLTVSNSVTLQTGSTTRMDISKTPPTNDQLRVTGALTYGGILIVTNLGATALADGDSFNIFSAASYFGSFANIVPSPGPGLAWNTSTLSSDGTLRVSAVTYAPAIASFVASPGNLILGGSNGTIAGYYYLLSSARLDTPLSNWTILSTNIFDVNGGFQVTNPSGPAAPQQFFMLQIP